MNVKLGLKGNIAQVDDRIKYNPDIYEVHLDECDLFGEQKKKLIDLIEKLKSKGIKVYLHHPMMIDGEFLHINSNDNIIDDYLNLTTRILIDLCEKYDLKCIIHINYGSLHGKIVEDIYANKDDLITTVHNILQFVNKYGKEYILIENGILGVGGYRDDFVLANLLKDTSIKLCMDLSHLAISLESESEFELNNEIEHTLDLLKDNIDYYHVVDSQGKDGIHDSLPLDKGLIDWKRFKPLIMEKDYIYEVGLADFSDCVEMIESYHYFLSL